MEITGDLFINALVKEVLRWSKIE